MNFNKAMEYSKSFNESNDCTVKAIAIACDVSYPVAHKALKEQRRVNRRGAFFFQQKDALESLGFKMEPVQLQAKTVVTLGREAETLKGSYMVYVKGHVLAVRRGKVEDWTEGRRHKIKEGYKIVPTVSRKERQKLIKELMQG